MQAVDSAKCLPIWCMQLYTLPNFGVRCSATIFQIGSHLDSVPAGPGINDNG